VGVAFAPPLDPPCEPPPPAELGEGDEEAVSEGVGLASPVPLGDGTVLGEGQSVTMMPGDTQTGSPLALLDASALFEALALFSTSEGEGSVINPAAAAGRALGAASKVAPSSIGIEAMPAAVR